MSQSRRPGKRAYLMITVFALLLVLFPFLFWYSTWFGRPLNDSDLDKYFADTAHPRHAQHALVQIGERMSHHRDVSRWYPQIVRASASPSVELRQTAAWIMGQDRNYAPFHAALAQLIHDPETMVRRNAALGLAAFGDPAARPELVAMLRPFTVRSPVAGTVRYRLKVEEYVNPGTLVAHVGTVEVRASAPGEVRGLARNEGATVQSGDALAELGPDKGHAWEALRALYLVGEPADLEDVERFTHTSPSISETLAKQATEAAEAIRTRAARL
jgi:biotin carboxyl carrier protein